MGKNLQRKNLRRENLQRKNLQRKNLQRKNPQRKNLQRKNLQRKKRKNLRKKRDEFEATKSFSPSTIRTVSVCCNVEYKLCCIAQRTIRILVFYIFENYIFDVCIDQVFTC